MLIEILGLDPYAVSRLSQNIQPALVALTKAEAKHMFFVAHESMLIHTGVDQNAWHTWVKIHMPKSYDIHQAAMIKLFQQYLSDDTVHLHFQWIYQPDTQIDHVLQSDYPDFVTEKNQVAVETNQDPISDQDIYHGNVFEGKEESLEKASKIIPPKKKATN